MKTEAELFLGSDDEKPRRDRWGRYVFRDPRTGQFKPRGHGFTRASTFSGTLSDRFSIAQWQQRNLALGLAKRSDLLARAAGKDVREDRVYLNKLCDEARKAAGEGISSSVGTGLHRLTEQVDRGIWTLSDVPVAYRSFVSTYVEAMKRYRLTTEAGLVERSILCTSLGEDVGGTFDRVVRCSDGVYRIADLKTGRDPLRYGDAEIAVQLLTYAEGFNENGLYDWSSDQWVDPEISVETDYGLVVHLPVEGPAAGSCTVHQVDFTPEVYGWARVCAAVRRETASKKHKWSKPYEPEGRVSMEGVEDPFAGVTPVQGVYDLWVKGWEGRFASVTSLPEAHALWEEAKAAGVMASELERLSLVSWETLRDKG